MLQLSSVWSPRKQVWSTPCIASGQCDKPAKCVNCSGDHPANSKECPQWEKEKQILKIKCEQNISFPEAQKQFEQLTEQKPMQVQ